MSKWCWYWLRYNHYSSTYITFIFVCVWYPLNLGYCRGSSTWASANLLITSLNIPWTHFPSMYRPSGYCILPIPCLNNQKSTSHRCRNCLHRHTHCSKYISPSPVFYPLSKILYIFQEVSQTISIFRISVCNRLWKNQCRMIYRPRHTFLGHWTCLDCIRHNIYHRLRRVNGQNCFCSFIWNCLNKCCFRIIGSLSLPFCLLSSLPHNSSYRHCRNTSLFRVFLHQWTLLHSSCRLEWLKDPFRIVSPSKTVPCSSICSSGTRCPLQTFNSSQSPTPQCRSCLRSAKQPEKLNCLAIRT